MSSMMPWGKFGALPTRRMVLEFRRRETWLSETLYEGAGQGTRWTRMRK